MGNDFASSDGTGIGDDKVCAGIGINVISPHNVKIDIIRILDKYFLHKQIEKRNEKLFLRMKKRRISRFL